MRYDANFGSKEVIIKLTNGEVIFGKLKNDDGKFIELENPKRVDEKGRLIQSDEVFVSRDAIKMIQEGTEEDFYDVAEDKWPMSRVFAVILIQLIIAMIFLAPMFIF